MSRPLDGLLVVSLEQAIAAPYCTRLLADQGARVIKVERPDGGDFARAYDTRARGLAPSMLPGLSPLARLQAEARAGIEAVLTPSEFAGLLQTGENLGHADVCDLLAKAVQST